MVRQARTRKKQPRTLLTRRYYRCKKTELARFATNRGLLVPNTSKNPLHGPSQDDYVRALKQADTEASFRFLDLPPEMRNLVYKELVVLQDSWYCHPQILATCTQVHKEASSVLYGDNLIEVKIYEDGVVAHGKRCGPYYPPGLGSDFRSLVWPDFLRRVQHLRLAVVELPRRHARVASVGNIVASLCSSLALGHRLSSLNIDLDWLNQRGLRGGMDMALSPLRLLGPVPQLTIRGFWDLAPAVVAAMRQAVAEPAPRTSCTRAIEEITVCAEVCVALGGGANPPLRSVDVTPWALIGSVGKGMRLQPFFDIYVVNANTATPGLLSHGIRHGVTWDNEVLAHVDLVRFRYERADFAWIDPALHTKVEGILRRGIDLRARRVTEA